MKRIFGTLGASVILAAPLVLGAPLPNRVNQGAVLTVGQTSQEMNAFSSSKYSFWDARVLALFWGAPVSQAKAFMGRTVLTGGQSVVDLDHKLTTARSDAMNQTQQLRLFTETYSFQDAETLGRFWGERSTWDAKLRTERKLILGDQQVVNDALAQARRTAAPPPPPPNNTPQDGQVFSLLPMPAQMTGTARPNFQAQFSSPPDRRTLRFVVDQIDHSREVSYSSSGQTIRWTPSSDLPPGNHVVDVSAVGQNRETFATHWTFTTPQATAVKPPPPVFQPTGMSVSNLGPGNVLGSRFSVNGRGIPGSTVTVQVEYPKQDVISQLSGVMLRFQNQGRVDSNGNFSIPMDAQEVPRGQPMIITVMDSANSPLVSLKTERGADNQIQPDSGGVTPSSSLDQFYDRQNNFGLNIQPGWVRISPSPNMVFKVSDHQGSTFEVGVGPARNPQQLINDSIMELNRQNNRVNSQTATKIGGLSATRIEYSSNNSNTTGILVTCVTGRNQTFLVGAESTHLNNSSVRRDIDAMFSSFLINSR
ncbi:hypothetical protein IV102_14110 [bacterium]|nr:hypothetical protein [bacterium]